jgi:methionine synthase II (cobalamin-independent)
MDANLRTDQVGSLLRPQTLKDVYTRHCNGEATDEELRRAQDESVDALIAEQQSRGFCILTDGKYRRLNFQDSDMRRTNGRTWMTAIGRHHELRKLTHVNGVVMRKADRHPRGGSK